jgi:hypothetical protein
LRPLTEQLLRPGAWTYTLLSPFRTIAGIAAACEGDWISAEEHHLCAVRQTDTAPYRHRYPVALEWYARMLPDRRAEGDEKKARQLLRNAIAAQP